MKKACTACGGEFYVTLDSLARPITGDFCPKCVDALAAGGDKATRQTLLDTIAAPIILMQPEPKRVGAANVRAAEMFGKAQSQMEGLRGGQVFDCLNAFTAAGCGEDDNCADCKIKAAVVSSLTSGTRLSGVATTLPIKRGDAAPLHAVSVSTERVGDVALLRIDRFQMEA